MPSPSSQVARCQGMEIIPQTVGLFGGRSMIDRIDVNFRANM